MDSKKSEHLHMRISSKLKDQLKLRAEAEGRTLSNYVEHVLRQALTADAEITERR